MQTTSQLLMIQPVHFAYNSETAVNNSFQVQNEAGNIQQQALPEFNNFVALLRSKGINVMVVEDSVDPPTPDSIFPNNWISFHEPHTICLYPMFAVNRRAERKPALINTIQKTFAVQHVVDYSAYEEKQQFLEGTGSMVLDRDNKIAYACISPRTDPQLLNIFCARMGYEPVSFNAIDHTGQPVYHTNVMMCVADEYAVVCLDSIPSPQQKQTLITSLQNGGKKIIAISTQQVNHFAGNMLQVKNTSGKKFIVMSTRAMQSLTRQQVEAITRFNEIIHAPLTAIETNGGGSARCMMAEVFV